MNGVKIGDKHSGDDFGLILLSKEISTPEPQTKMVSVPMRDGSIDMTQELTDDIKYEDRQINMSFAFMDPRSTWSSKISEIENYLHGKRMKIIFDDDAAFYYIGRIYVDKWSSQKAVGSIVIGARAEPYKYDIISSSDDWEWDVFDFETGILNEVSQVDIIGRKTIVMICRRKKVVPKITVSNDMDVSFCGKSYRLKKGSQKIYDILFSEGENELEFIGNGTVSIDYTGGSL